MSGRGFFWLLVAVTLAIYLAMVLWTLPGIAADAGGLLPFDLRPLGYAPSEARAFLEALGADGRALYLGPQKWLDTVYPALLATVLALALRHFLASDRPGLRAALTALPVVASGFDYLENVRVRQLLLADAPGDAMIEAASFATQAKSLLATLAMLALVALLARAGWRRWR